MPQWRNWSGSVMASPERIERPRTEAELARLVAGARRVRVAGTGHSFMPLCETDGLLLSLAELAGPIEVAADRQSAWVPAGMSIGALTHALWEEGLSLANQGDIDKQAIAGALATATHGTGRTLGALSTFARGFRLVLTDGSVVECDAEREKNLFEAQRVSLGALGVMSRVKLAVVPAYRLKETLRRVPLSDILNRWDELAAHHRHVEFFVFPYADEALLKILEPVESGDDPPPSGADNLVMGAACETARLVPALAPGLQRLMMKAIGGSTRSAPAYRIFPSERATRFEEMEYEIPAANGAAALRAAIGEVRQRRLPITFPFEYRAVAGDDIWLSPMSAGECVSISFHQYARMPWREAFAAIEPVFAAHGGRPHWAKRHSLVSDDVLRLYSNAGRWGEVRKRVDPEGKFLNAHLRKLLEFSL
ncbi:MAG TPA: D-arabinono-1,4-lactone oxidase [Caulobacteraceae bacterium]|jgi:FAD-linked oxidoreductase|nr:D-arabinono-1,4-lactone oxidase [Caulobacteraceae bacterium]